MLTLGGFLSVILFSAAVLATVESPTHTYNVTSPEPNAPYVAGQILPIRYTLPEDSNLPRLLSLSVYLATTDATLNFTQATISSHADISQGFSFRRMQGPDAYIEHEMDYAIPNTTLPGNYIVVFVDSISLTNTTIPVTIRPYAPPNQAGSTNGKSQPTGSIFGLQSKATSLTNSWNMIAALGACIFVWHVVN